jgi:hypothetical protein
MDRTLASDGATGYQGHYERRPSWGPLYADDRTKRDYRRDYRS